MRVVLVLAVCIAAATASLAQETQMPTLITGIRWVERPDAADFERNYPSAALRAGIIGGAILCCAARDDGTVDCRAGHEWPANRDFGVASLEVAKSFRMDEESVARFQAAPNASIRVPITFLRADMSEEHMAAYEALRARINARTEGLCTTAAPQPTN